MTFSRHAFETKLNPDMVYFLPALDAGGFRTVQGNVRRSTGKRIAQTAVNQLSRCNSEARVSFPLNCHSPQVKILIIVPDNLDDQFNRTQIIIQTVLTFADIHRSDATQLNSLRQKYMTKHPKSCPHLLILNIDYNLFSSGPQPRSHRPFTFTFYELSTLPLRVGLVGSESFVEIVRDVLTYRKIYYTVTISLNRKERTVLRNMPIGLTF